MASEVSICNRALVMLGARTIVSLDDNLTEARVMKALYPEARDSVLREIKPACATFRSSLAKMAESPAFGYANQFRLPTDPYCLAVINVNGSYDYIVEDRKILTDNSTCAIHFIGRMADVSVIDAATAYAIAARVAAEAAYALTQNRTLTADMWSLAANAADESMNADAIERGSDAITAEQFENARR